MAISLFRRRFPRIEGWGRSEPGKKEKSEEVGKYAIGKQWSSGWNPNHHHSNLAATYFFIVSLILGQGGVFPRFFADTSIRFSSSMSSMSTSHLSQLLTETGFHSTLYRKVAILPCLPFSMLGPGARTQFSCVSQQKRNMKGLNHRYALLASLWSVDKSQPYNPVGRFLDGIETMLLVKNLHPMQFNPHACKKSQGNVKHWDFKPPPPRPFSQILNFDALMHFSASWIFTILVVKLLLLAKNIQHGYDKIFLWYMTLSNMDMTSAFFDLHFSDLFLQHRCQSCKKKGKWIFVIFVVNIQYLAN